MLVPFLHGVHVAIVHSATGVSCLKTVTLLAGGANRSALGENLFVGERRDVQVAARDDRQSIRCAAPRFPGRQPLGGAGDLNGVAGAVIFVARQATAVMGFLVRDGLIVAIDVLADPEQIARIDVTAKGAPS